MRLVDGIDEEEVMDCIAQGMTQTAIARKYKVDQANYNRWLYADKHRLARARDAMTRAAQSYSDMVIDELDAASDALELAKAREKAHHLRWLAARYNRALFGDKLEVSGDQTITVLVTRNTGEIIDVSPKNISMDGSKGGVVQAGGGVLEGNPTSTALHGVYKPTHGVPQALDIDPEIAKEKTKKRKSKGSWINGVGVMLTEEELEKDTK